MNRTLICVILLIVTACSAKPIASQSNANDKNNNASQAAQVAGTTSATGTGARRRGRYEFDTVTVNSRGAIVSRRKGQARYYVEDLNGAGLEMVEIPEGSFTMGSSVPDQGQPRHQVNVPSFYMGKYEVTQAQWRAVASLPKVSRDLNPDPSYFKGDDRPVERVSWRAAMEFCARLSHLTGKTYRLPSEAEWEYACRGKTTTAYAFGETITSELVNYNGNNNDNPFSVAKWMNRKQTTPVGSLKVANGFGLYDVHGNVWEWCLDYWHLTYQGAPTDGSAWKAGRDTGSRITRGGGWRDYAINCTATWRSSSWGGSVDTGFRVVEQASGRNPAYAEPIVSEKARHQVESFLAASKDYHLLALTDIPQPILEAVQHPQEQADHHYPGLDLQQVDMLDVAVSERDANGDGVVDVLAIIVRGDNDPKRYSVICFNGKKGTGYNPKPFWVVKDSSRFLGDFDVEEAGLFAKPKKYNFPSPATIRLLYDSLGPYGEDRNDFSRWNGSEYELKYFVANEDVKWEGEIKLFSLPTETSKVVKVLNWEEQEISLTLRILSPVLAKVEGVRWYKVELLKDYRRTKIIGFVSGAHLQPCRGGCD
jgi:formylglycine-generating enzyme required for sulfatase activity